MNDEIVLEYIQSLKKLIDSMYGKYLNISAEEMLLNGGCYEFAKIMKRFFPNGKIYLRNDAKHCAIEINKSLYDASGKIEDIDNYKLATDIDLQWMQNEFGKDYKFLKISNNVNDVIDKTINNNEMEL